MKEKIQNRINDLLIKIRALDKSKHDKEVEDKQKELDALIATRNNLNETVNAYQQEINFLEAMFIKYKELEDLPVEEIPSTEIEDTAVDTPLEEGE